ncbi:M48 family metallopeptidase [Lichenihabitans sp. PAMC28606]|uniref:M48 family metallopeptidase n=1 Tax=Lichenihabitans sp. PAMC28606 TaxID=2880932 RepID=UPI001D0A1889|nr:SprT family zinc-dependent metalloprotease [Lichenihabitans sp. PAMC28606]UDL95854.1 M48 family metallopeptidase [Lichenihabitans sp. PAMC28606]
MKAGLIDGQWAIRSTEQLRHMLQLFRNRTATPTPEPAFVEIQHGARRYRIPIKRVNGARRFTLRVRAATLDAVLTMPKGSSLRAAKSFAERHAEWVGTRLDVLPRKIPLAAGSVIPFRGVPVSIVARQSLRAAAWIEETSASGRTETRICVSGDPEQQHKRVLDLLRREARRDLEAAVIRHTATLGKTARSITLRDTRSRWGSCTSQGSLNFSWRLIMAPPHVLDYLAAHEVAHLAHMDHSPAYWAVAARLAPALASAEAWLKQNGASLHLYG